VCTGACVSAVEFGFGNLPLVPFIRDIVSLNTTLRRQKRVFATQRIPCDKKKKMLAFYGGNHPRRSDLSRRILIALEFRPKYFSEFIIKSIHHFMNNWNSTIHSGCAVGILLFKGRHCLPEVTNDFPHKGNSQQCHTCYIHATHVI